MISDNRLQPIATGIPTFEHLRKGGYLYIDKTPLLYRMIKEYTGIFFCARPRRFGKSLAISTLKAIFEGKKELFDGLYLADTDYDWQTYPVIHLDFGRSDTNNKEEFIGWLMLRLTEIAESYGISIDTDNPIIFFDMLIERLANKCNQRVVILIDEYDKPMSDHVDDLQTMREMKALMHSFYQILKGTSSYQRFLFMTGVTKYAKMSIFSGLNNLSDISMQPQYATLFGYTQEELELYFADHISAYLENSTESIDKDAFLLKLKQWYNGYLFHDKTQTVYNPVSIGKFFDEGCEFIGHWVDTGTPSMLIDALDNQLLDSLDIEDKEVSSDAFDVFELERLAQGELSEEDVLALLYQTGYITLNERIPMGEFFSYSLRYPNKEVKNAYVRRILNRFLQTPLQPLQRDIYKAVYAGDVAKTIDCVKDYFTQFGYDIQVKQEKYYQSLMYALFSLVGLNVRTEQTTNVGRIDAILETPDHLYIFELKLDQSAQDAIQQIQDRGYADRFMRKAKENNQTIHLVGMNFNSETRNIDDWDQEVISLK